MPNKKKIVTKKKGEVIHEARISSIDNDKEGKRFSRNRIRVLILFALMILLILIFFCLRMFNFGDSKDQTMKNFKKEYESLNDQLDRNGNAYQNLSIDSNNVIQYADYHKIFSVLERGTGILFFCAPEYQACRSLVPILLESADEVGVDTIYYLNPTSDRDQKEMEPDGKVITTKEGTKEYHQLLKKLDSVVDDYVGLGNSSVKRLYLPTVVFVEDGEIIFSHTLENGVLEESFWELSAERKSKLKSDFIEVMSKIITCDETC